MEYKIGTRDLDGESLQKVAQLFFHEKPYHISFMLGKTLFEYGASTSGGIEKSSGVTVDENSSDSRLVWDDRFVGSTTVTCAELEKRIVENGTWNDSAYRPKTHNCCHFVDFCWFCVSGKHLPFNQNNSLILLSELPVFSMIMPANNESAPGVVFRTDFYVKRHPSDEGKIMGYLNNAMLQINSTDMFTVFQQYPIEKGIFRWNIRISYKKPTSIFRFGIVPQSSVNLGDLKYPGLNQIAGSASLNFSCTHAFVPEDANPNYYASLVGGKDKNINVKEIGIPHNSEVSAEVDANLGTLCFFVNNKKLSNAFCNIPTPLRIGISSYNAPAFTSISFVNFPFPTPSSIECQFHSCN